MLAVSEAHIDGAARAPLRFRPCRTASA